MVLLCNNVLEIFNFYYTHVNKLRYVDSEKENANIMYKLYHIFRKTERINWTIIWEVRKMAKNKIHIQKMDSSYAPAITTLKYYQKNK